jgi:hypothetical protein
MLFVLQKEAKIMRKCLPFASISHGAKKNLSEKGTPYAKLIPAPGSVSPMRKFLWRKRILFGKRIPNLNPITQYAYKAEKTFMLPRK